MAVEEAGGGGGGGGDDDDGLKTAENNLNCGVGATHHSQLSLSPWPNGVKANPCGRQCELYATQKL